MEISNQSQLCFGWIKWQLIGSRFIWFPATRARVFECKLSRTRWTPMNSFVSESDLISILNFSLGIKPVLFVLFWEENTFQMNEFQILDNHNSAIYPLNNKKG